VFSPFPPGAEGLNTQERTDILIYFEAFCKSKFIKRSILTTFCKFNKKCKKFSTIHKKNANYIQYSIYLFNNVTILQNIFGCGACLTR
jgi:hypothetical protein